MRLLQKFHSSVPAHSHRRLFSPPLHLPPVSLCILSCPDINPSIYSRSLPTLAVCVTGKLRSGRRTLNAQLCPGRRRKRLWERPGRKKAPLTDWQTPVSPCPPLSPLSPSARRQQTTGIWREGGQGAKSRGFVWAAGLRPGECPRGGERGVRDGDGGESSGMTSPQDPLHPPPPPL